MTDTYKIFIPNYGTYDFKAATRGEAEQEAQRKRKHEGASSCLAWLASETTEFDKVTSQIHKYFSSGEGCPERLFAKRKKARELLKGSAP